MLLTGQNPHELMAITIGQGRVFRTEYTTYFRIYDRRNSGIHSGTIVWMCRR